MGLGNLLKSAISSATEYALETGENQLNNRKLASHLKKIFENPVSASKLNVGDFIANLFGEDGSKYGVSFQVSHKELVDLEEAWVLVAYPFGNNCSARDDEQHFSSVPEPALYIKRRFARLKKLDSRKQFAEECITSALEPLDEDDGFDSQVYACLIAGLEKLKTCSIEKTSGPDANKNFQNWLEEAVDPILKMIKDQQTVHEKLLAGSMPVEAHIGAFSNFLENDAKLDDLLGENQGEMVRLYKAMHDAFDRKGLIAINKLATVPKDVHRINQIETIIDLYNLKISRTEKDKKMDADVKARKVQALQHLMEKDIEALGGAV